MSDIVNLVMPGLSVVITTIITVFLFLRRKSEREIEIITSQSTHRKNEDEKTDSNIEKLVLRGDVELRLLEEITEVERNHCFYYPRGKSKRELVLENIARELRKLLRKSVDSDNFTEIQNRIIDLLDKIQADLKEIGQKKPFDGLDDPERSLLVDIIEELPSEKHIPLQKAHQLADVIKVKHQDIKRLQLENSKSASWTRWGTVGTVSFGLLSLALSIYTIYQ